MPLPVMEGALEGAMEGAQHAIDEADEVQEGATRGFECVVKDDGAWQRGGQKNNHTEELLEQILKMLQEQEKAKDKKRSKGLVGKCLSPCTAVASGVRGLVAPLGFYCAPCAPCFPKKAERFPYEPWDMKKAQCVFTPCAAYMPVCRNGCKVPGTVPGSEICNSVLLPVSVTFAALCVKCVPCQRLLLPCF